jgi:hypothetical protein
MIDLNLPDPPHKTCVYCGKTRYLKGKLIHWPSEEYVDEKIYTMLDGTQIEPFSLWIYTCAWCRGIITKREKQKRKNAKIGESFILRLPGEQCSFRCDCCQSNVFTKIGVEKGWIRYQCNGCGAWYKGQK